MTLASATRIIASAALAAIALNATAQDIRTELKGQRKVTPIERDARRPSAIMPRIFDPVAEKVSLQVAEYTAPSAITPALNRLEPVAWGDTIAVTPWRGYASLGYLPAYNLGASAGYRFINTHRTRLGGWMQFDGFNYKGDIQTPVNPDGIAGPALYESKKETFKSNTATVGFRLDHRVGTVSQLTARAGFSYSNIVAPCYGDGFKMPVLDFGLGASWWSKIGSFGYHVDASADRFDYNFNYRNPDFLITSGAVKGQKETTFSVGGGIVTGRQDGRRWGGLDIKARFLNRSNADDADNLGLITLTPYYGFDSDSFHGRLGLDIDFNTGYRSATHFAPEVSLTWTPLSQLAIYGKLTGGDRLNTLRHFFNYSPLSNPGSVHFISRVPLDATLGLNLGPVAGLSLEVFAAYTAASAWEMPDVFAGYVFRSPSAWNTLFASQDLHGARAGAKVSYDWRSIVKASIAVEATPDYDEPDRGYYLWLDRARFDFRAALEINPLEPLKFEASYNIRTGRHTFIYTAADENGSFYSEPQPASLGRMALLDMGASYRLTPRFTVFANVSNILNKHWQVMNGIPSRGINGLAGVSYMF